MEICLTQHSPGRSKLHPGNKHSYKYRGVVLDNKLEWSTNTVAVYKKGLSRLHFLRRLRSFDVCNWMFQMLYQSVVSTIFFAVVWRGAGIKAKDANRLNKLKKNPEPLVGSKLVTLEEVVEHRMLAKLQAIMDNVSQPLHKTVDQLKSSFSNRLIQPRCLQERHRNHSYLVPSDFTTLHNKTQNTQNYCVLYYYVHKTAPYSFAPYVLTYIIMLFYLPQYFIHLSVYLSI